MTYATDRAAVIEAVKSVLGENGYARTYWDQDGAVYQPDLDEVVDDLADAVLARLNETRQPDLTQARADVEFAALRDLLHPPVR